VVVISELDNLAVLAVQEASAAPASVVAASDVSAEAAEVALASVAADAWVVAADATDNLARYPAQFA
jgi:hypothetical protein